MTTLTQAQTRQRNIWQLWMLILLFALPPIVAWLFYLNPQWLPQGRTNHGQLIDPPRAMQPVTLQTPDGETFDWQLLKDQWTLTIVAEGRCDAQCLQQLIKVRQIRRALGANRQRVERLLIMLPDAAGNLTLPSLEGLEGTRLVSSARSERSSMEAQVTINGTPFVGSLFLIDPRVDLMMAHDMTQITSKQILQDLQKLLKASQSWVKGGQYGHQ
ncbi:MAG: hypothetical protein QNJ78_12675 [Gammaproteobacteria bacterium]|nr:hypothetical protein [Gammaproteobacteria bacterium]